MSRFEDFLTRFQVNKLPKIIPIQRQTIFVDFGSANTRLITNGQLVFHQPTSLVYQPSQQAVLAIGDQAAQFLSQGLASLELAKPLQYGVIADPTLSKLYLQAVIKTQLQQPQIWWQRFSGYLAVPAGITPVEKTALTRVLNRVGWGQLKLVSKAQALINRLKQHQLSQDLLIIDLGAQVTELALLTQGQLVSEQTIEFGGQLFTKTIQDLVKQHHACEISWSTALKLHHQLGSLQSTNEHKLVIRGKDLLTGTSKTLTVSAHEFQPELLDLSKNLATELKWQLTQLPTAALVKALNQGIFLTGGASQLNGLTELLTKELGGEVILSPTPSLDVVQGLAS
ncbi:MAG: hypothetical protein GF390_04070 [Candidatus Pacebacteria bacterium]|nr:hypothetical protein [Candidatus Paceibacterota bacterium]